MKYLLTGNEMAGADRRTWEIIGIPAIVLMERAALSVAQEVAGRFPGRTKVTILAGPGNNGADGLAVGRLLIDRGYSVQFLLLTGEEPPQDSSAMIQRKILEAYGEEPEVFSKDAMYSFSPEIIVDALFGTGLGRPLSGDAALIAQTVNAYREETGCKVAAVDLPSGISSEDGSVMGCAVRCDLTVTFAYYKRGHFLYPGCSYCGETVLRQIGIHDRSFTCAGGALPEMYMIEHEDAERLLTERDPGGNKGTFGKILIVAGGYSMCGAALLCAEACMRSGAGMVKIFTREENRVIIQERLPEAMLTVYEAVPDSIAMKSYAVRRIRESLMKDLAWADAVAVGPGIGRGPEARVILKTILAAVSEGMPADASGPHGQAHGTVGAGLRGLILDADAIRLIAADEKMDRMLQKRNREVVCIMTPHLAEFADLVHVPVKEAAGDRIALMRKAAERYGCTILGKDARTLVVTGGVRQICMITNGNSGMATAGSGDVLTGITAAMLFAAADKGCGGNYGTDTDPGMSGAADTDCRGHNAAQLAAYIHAAAGDLCREEKGEQAMLAGDMVSVLGGIFNALRHRECPEAAAIDVEAAPMEAVAAPMDVEAAPMDVKAAPMDVETAPMEAEAAPVDAPEERTGDEPAE